MLTKFIAKNIQEKMKAKERALARKNKPQTSKGYLSIKDMASRTCFVRMASNKLNERKNRLIEGGLHNDQGEKGFGFTYANSAYEGAVYDDQIKPIPGIKSVEVSYKGGFKALRECTVNWSVNSMEQLDDVTPHFLTIGKTVIVDWGWVYPNSNTQEQLSGTFITRKYITDKEKKLTGYDTIIDQSIFSNPQDIISKKNGDYDAIGGQVTNFEYNLREDGGFDCVTKIISMGAAIFKKPIDVGGNMTGQKSNDGNTESTPPDSLINCILNLRDIIVWDVFKITDEVLPAPGKDLKISWKSWYSVGVTVDESKKVTQQKYLRNPKSEHFKKHNIWFPGGLGTDLDDMPQQMAVDDKKDVNILWVTYGKQREDIFVTWGWFEDNILNRYVSFQGGKDKDVKLTIRSIDTVLDKGTQKPIEYDEDKIDEINTDDNILDMHLPMSRTNKFEDGVKNPTKFFKKSSLIRNLPGLYPVNPFKFFIIGGNFQGMVEGSLKEWSLSTMFEDVKNKYSARLSAFYKAFIIPNGHGANFKFFESKENKDFGKLRNVYVNIKEIQTAFGIRNPDSTDTSNSNINPAGDIETALNTLLSSLNTNFHNIWDFELSLDPFDSTNLKIIDKADAEIDNPQYTKYQDGDETDTHKVSELGIFQMPAYKMGSFVKNQSLTFKIPDKQALTILYGSNKTKGDGNTELASSQMDKLFKDNTDEVYKDAYLEGLKSSHQNSSGNDSSINPNVGSQFVNPNSKISFGAELGVTIDVNKNHEEGWWRQWSPAIDSSGDNDSSGEGNDPLEPKGHYNVVENEKGEPDVLFIKEGKPNIKPPLYSYDEATDHITLKSGAQYVLNKFLNASSPVAQFDMSSLIPADLGLTIDGIGGIVPFDLIHTDYIQHKYKAEITSTNEDKEEKTVGPLTYFQIFGVDHKIDPTGWTTEITAKMRINKIPHDDKLTYGMLPKEKKKKPKVVRTRYQYTEVGYELSEPERGVVEKAEQAKQEVTEETWAAPTVASTIPAQKMEKEKEKWVGPKVINNGIPPEEEKFEPEVDPDMGMTEEEFNNMALNVGTLVKGNDTDLVPYPPKPSPKVKPVIPKMKLRPSNNYKTSYDSLLEQIETQKIICTGTPNTEAVYKTGEVPKLERFEAPPVEELVWDAPEVVQVAVNETIKKKLPETKQLAVVDKELDIVDPVSTFQNKTANPDSQVRINQNEVLYSLREDWRPLYIRTAGPSRGKLTGRRITKYNKVRYNNVQTREKQDMLTIRQPYWDKYIEEKSVSGVTKTSFTTRDNFSYPGGETAYPEDLIRRERSVYWYSEEWNPGYEEKKAALKSPDNYKITE